MTGILVSRAGHGMRVACATTLTAAMVAGFSAGANAATESVLHAFAGLPDGSGPSSALIADSSGNLYGATAYGGTNGQGSVYELSPNGRGGYTESVIYSFCSLANCADGSYPFFAFGGLNGQLIFDGSGNLYGTTAAGGANGAGTVFELSPGANDWVETILYSFCSQPSCADSYYPVSGLTFDQSGNLYGTTAAQGDNAKVYELSPNNGGWTEQVIFGVHDESAGVTVDAQGNVYGIDNYYSGRVFELSPSGGGWTSKYLYTFTGGKDGSGLNGTLVLDASGNLYGTTASAGSWGCGTAYRLSPWKNGTWKETTLWAQKSKKGCHSYAGLTFDSAGNIYGTASSGGKYNDGVVFELSPSATKYTETTLWSFDGSDGEDPLTNVMLNGQNIFGTTFEGGTDNNGVVFELTP